MTVHPVPGRLVRCPVTGREITGPTDVPDNDPFWLRRLADGDVGRASVPVSAATPKAKE